MASHPDGESSRAGLNRRSGGAERRRDLRKGKRGIVTMEKEYILQETQRFVVSEMEKNDTAHDGDHVRRVVKLAKTLCRAYPQADGFRTELLAWLHDMSDDKLVSNMGAERVSAFLRGCRAAEEDIRFIVEAIPYTRSSCW